MNQTIFKPSQAQYLSKLTCVCDNITHLPRDTHREDLDREFNFIHFAYILFHLPKIFKYRSLEYCLISRFTSFRFRRIIFVSLSFSPSLSSYASFHFYLLYTFFPLRHLKDYTYTQT